ncbi:peptidyl-tRNA hydrolase [Actinocatenispora rupis]|uniref:peptidyl-tRNA hydrolase n=1 Tax=Actinocatenispora rupis TaxID=519421 RepID=UPI0019411FC2|nr:peptidyl-tRNA hydrolase [Actinocatenispora rupis]
MSAPTDPRDAAPQYVLPLVVRLERAEPPERTDALEASARAVLTFLTDPRTTDPAGDWHDAVHAWTDGRIRKVVRRARGAEWRRAEALDGLTVRHRSATVRVFPPVPLDGWPRDLARLQVGGTDLDDTEPPAAPAAGTPVLWLNPALTMTAGKAMAQTGHGAQLTYAALPAAAREIWADAGFPLAVRTASPERWRHLAGSGLPVVHDAGFTEVAPNSATVIGDHPALRLP